MRENPEDFKAPVSERRYMTCPPIANMRGQELLVGRVIYGRVLPTLINLFTEALAS